MCLEKYVRQKANVKHLYSVFKRNGGSESDHTNISSGYEINYSGSTTLTFLRRPMVGGKFKGFIILFASRNTVPLSSIICSRSISINTVYGVVRHENCLNFPQFSADYIFFTSRERLAIYCLGKSCE